VSTPTIVRKGNLVNTSQAIRARIQGCNIVEAVVLPDGTVGDVRVIQSLDTKYGLDNVKGARLDWGIRGSKAGSAEPRDTTGKDGSSTDYQIFTRSRGAR
jgi:hypothetical protein